MQVPFRNPSSNEDPPLKLSILYCEQQKYERRVPAPIWHQAGIASQIDDGPYVPIYWRGHLPGVIVFDSRISNFYHRYRHSWGFARYPKRASGKDECFGSPPWLNTFLWWFLGPSFCVYIPVTASFAALLPISISVIVGRISSDDDWVWSQ